MTSVTSTPAKVSVRVESEPRAKDYEPILVTCQMVYLIVEKFDKAVVSAKVTKGKKPVLDAVVLARVYRPEKDPQPIKFPLHDDAEVPDFQQNDGRYFGYFVDFIGKGRYTAMVEVSNQNSTRLAYALSGSDSFLAPSFLHATTAEEKQSQWHKQEPRLWVPFSRCEMNLFCSLNSAMLCENLDNGMPY
ncbi:hypothetical protein V5799_009672 [Amblyomma americanum]|uniref:Uncharacterized protein n=1 Tax=Amblyomma americanum TaxID=6943 RepID=A0AAQ4FBC1_AMBAM